jgi:SAM-dependent methyltransferase
MREAPFQPATNLWRCIELPVLARALPRSGLGLDIGCGDGVLTGILRDLIGADWSLVGIDPDPAEIALAEQSGVYKQLHGTGADRIPQPDRTFDFAFANSVLEHIPNLSSCLGELARCLKPGGLFLATVPSPHLHDCLKGPDWTRRISRGDYLKETDERLGHVQYWSAERWCQELASAGLEVEEVTPYMSSPQVGRWEFWTNWTGGLLYRVKGKSQKPLVIQRSLGMRRGLPRPLGFLAPLLARLVSRGVRGQDGPKAEATGGFLVQARRVRI